MCVCGCTRQHISQEWYCTVCHTIKGETNGTAGQVRTKAQGRLDLNRHRECFTVNARRPVSKEGDSAGGDSHRVED